MYFIVKGKVMLFSKQPLGIISELTVSFKNSF